MGYSGPMSFSMEIPIHQVGGPEKLWCVGGYGLLKGRSPFGMLVPL